MDGLPGVDAGKGSGGGGSNCAGVGISIDLGGGPSVIAPALAPLIPISLPMLDILEVKLLSPLLANANPVPLPLFPSSPPISPALVGKRTLPFTLRALPTPPRARYAA